MNYVKKHWPIFALIALVIYALLRKGKVALFNSVDETDGPIVTYATPQPITASANMIAGETLTLPFRNNTTLSNLPMVVDSAGTTDQQKALYYDQFAGISGYADYYINKLGVKGIV